MTACFAQGVDVSHALAFPHLLTSQRRPTFDARNTAANAQPRSTVCFAHRIFFHRGLRILSAAAQCGILQLLNTSLLA
eukprot:7601411-Pyramimonas_sp.AAC.1